MRWQAPESSPGGEGFSPHQLQPRFLLADHARLVGPDAAGVVDQLVRAFGQRDDAEHVVVHQHDQDVAFLQRGIDVDQRRGCTTADIESFKALGVEVLLHSETYGDVWLVPAYTGRERKEITPEHAATLARVMSVFPGSHIVSFEKTAQTNNPERRERPLEERS